MTNPDRHASTGWRRRRIDRRTFLEVTGTGAAITTVAGCLGGSDDTDGNGDDPTESEDDTDEETTELDETLQIGHLAPLAYPMGLGSNRSAEIAVAELDEGGAFDGSVTLFTENTESDPRTAATAAERLIHQEGVDLVVGGYSDAVAQQIAPVAADTGVPFIVTGTGATAVLRDTVGAEYDRYRNVFRTGPINTDFQAEAMGEYAAFLADEHGWTSFAHLSEDTPWARSFRQRIPDEFDSRGLDVVFDGVVSPVTDNYTPYLYDIESAGTDALFRFFKVTGQGRLLAPWIEGAYGFGLEGIHHASTAPEFWEQTAGACSYEATAQVGAGGLVGVTDRTMSFVETYDDWFGSESPPSMPMPMGFATYDAIHFYAQAVAEAGTSDYENHLDDIVDAMLSIEYEGAAGPISLYGEGEAYPHDVRPIRDGSGTITSLQQLQWQPSRDADEGRKEVVFPPKHATAAHVRPPWL